MQSIDIALLRNNVAFTLTRRKFSNSKKVNNSDVRTEADKDMTSTSKKLLVSEELDAIHRSLDEIYSWCIARSMPSFFKKGIYFVKADNVPMFDAKLRGYLDVTLPPLVKAFQDAYATRIRQAQLKLNGLWDERDYPVWNRLPEIFGIGWNYLSFGVPDNLPSELREIEAKKLADRFAEAEQEILFALREGFLKVVDHVTERLLVPAGEQPKTFRNSLFDSLTDFVGTFSAKNLMNDAALESMVEKAKALLAEVNGNAPADKSNAIRDDRKLRDRIASGFAELKTAVGETIINKPSRKFELED